ADRCAIGRPRGRLGADQLADASPAHGGLGFLPEREVAGEGEHRHGVDHYRGQQKTVAEGGQAGVDGHWSPHSPSDGSWSPRCSSRRPGGARGAGRGGGGGGGGLQPPPVSGAAGWPTPPATPPAAGGGLAPPTSTIVAPPAHPSPPAQPSPAAPARARTNTLRRRTMKDRSRPPRTAI